MIDIACITIVCVCANHLGLIAAIEEKLHHSLPVINCPKCFTFWSVLFYLTVFGTSAIRSLAMSFICAYAAIWLDLAIGIIDYIYTKIYKLINTDSYEISNTNADADTSTAADADINREDAN